MLHRILQLAHVARPGMTDQRIDRGSLDHRGGAVGSTSTVPREDLREQRDVRVPLAQRRAAQRERAQTIVQVLAKSPRRHLALKIAVRRREHAHVDRVLLRSAEPTHLTILQDVEQLHLHRDWQLANLVEKQRAALGTLQIAYLPSIGAGERAALVAE